MARIALPASPEEPPPAEMGSSVMRFGSAVGAGALGAAIATAPATFRLEDAAGVCSPVAAWTLLIATMVLPMSFLVLVLRRARGGFLALGRGNCGVTLAVLLGWFGSTFVALALAGALLRAETHHRALAGVTFAITALALSLLLALVWARLAAILRRADDAQRWAMTGALGIGLVVTVASTRHELAGGLVWPLSTTQSVKLVDGLAFALGALVASWRPFVNRRALAFIGPPLAAVVLVLGASSLRACPSLREVLQRQAPAVSWMVGLISSN